MEWVSAHNSLLFLSVSLSPRSLGVQNGYTGVQLDGFSKKFHSFLQVTWNHGKRRVLEITQRIQSSLSLSTISNTYDVCERNLYEPSPRALMASTFFSLAWSIISSVTWDEINGKKMCCKVQNVEKRAFSWIKSLVLPLCLQRPPSPVVPRCQARSHPLGQFLKEYRQKLKFSFSLTKRL